MGAIWLGSMPDVLRSAGLNVQLWPGWETRSRGSGGYDSIMGIGVHLDAARHGTSLKNRCTYAWHNAPARPIGAMWLHDDGTVMIGAAGATNTQGRGGPYSTSKGVVPLNSGNRHLVSIEASSDGVHPWPRVQQDAYVKLCSALVGWLGLKPSDVISHFEWAPGRKIDPCGPSDYASKPYEKWNMDLFRSRIANSSVPELPGGNDMIHPIAPYRNSDTRVYGGNGLTPNQDHEFGLDPAKVPSDAVAVALSVAVIPSGSAGYCSVRPAGQPYLNTSTVNYEASGAHNGSLVCGVKDGKVVVRVSSQAHIILDVTGYWA